MNEPLRLCITDDVSVIVEGIRTQVAWDKHGIIIAGTAEDGEQAARLIEDVKPDIVITDIRMPKLDGLEVARIAMLCNSGCKVVILTGFSDFEYAQQAVKYGAFDFLIKPAPIEQIEAAVLKAKELIIAERSIHQHMKDMERKLKESMPLLKQEYTHLLLRHRSTEANALKYWDFIETNVQSDNVIVMVMELDRFEDMSLEMSIHEAELVRFSVQNISEETILAQTKGFVFRDGHQRFIAVMNVLKEEEAVQLAERCRANIAAYTRYTVSVGLGRLAASICGLPDSYRQAAIALSYYFYYGGNSVVVYNDMEDNSSRSPRYSYDKEHDFMMSLRSGNKDRSFQALEGIFEELMSQSPLPEPEYARSVYYELGSLMIRVFLEKLPYSDVGDLERKLTERGLHDRSSILEMKEQLKMIGEIGCSRLGSKMEKEANRVVDKAIQYIRDRLSSDFSLGDCANQVHLSTSYFSNVFSKTVGMTFVQFVTHERMERAKTLLLTGIQVQNTALEVGYEDRRYFSELFKKHTGRTPTEFQREFGKTI
jgi:two-component system response regulator YesN